MITVIMMITTTVQIMIKKSFYISGGYPNIKDVEKWRIDRN